MEKAKENNKINNNKKNNSAFTKCLTDKFIAKRIESKLRC